MKTFRLVVALFSLSAVGSMMSGGESSSWRPLEWTHRAFDSVGVSGSSDPALIAIGPDTPTFLRLDSRALLVAAASSGDPLAPRLVAWVSIDGRLFARSNFESRGAGEALLRRPVGRGVWYVRFEAVTERLEVRAFTLDESRPARTKLETLPARGEEVELSSIDGDTMGERYWLLEPGDSLVVDPGEARTLVVDSRYLYSPLEGVSRQTYRLTLRGADDSSYWFEHQTALAVGPGHLVDGRRQFLGRPRSGRFELSVPGPLRIESTAPVYLRVRAPERQALLLPEINQAVAALDPPGAVPHGGRSIWSFEPVELTSLLGRDAATVEPLMLWLSRDNHYRGSADQLVALSSALEWTADAETRARWASLVDSATRFRSLVPRVLGSRQSLRYAHFLPPTSAALVAELAPRRTLVREMREDALRGLAGAFFVAPGTRQETAPSYALGESNVARRLRILVTGAAASRATVWFETPGSAPRIFERLAAGELESLKATPSSAEAALSILSQQSVPPLTQQKGPLVDPARLELDLPANVTSLRLWSDTPGVEVAVQLLTPVRFRLSESESLHWIEFLERRGWTGEALFAALIARTPPRSSSNDEQVALRALWNHWLPLSRSLAERHRRFAEGLAMPGDYGGEPCQLAASTGDPLAQLAGLAAVRASCGSHPDFLERQVEALWALGDRSLADRVLRQTVAFGDDSLAERGEELLATESRAGAEFDRELTLRAAAALRHRDRHRLDRLTEALLANGQLEHALMLAAVTGAAEPMAGLALAAVERRGWRLFERIVERSEDAQAAQLWLGYRSLVESDLDGVEKRWALAGEAGAAAWSALRAAPEASASSSTDGNGEARRWREWEASQPGPLGWVNEGWAITGAAGADRVRVATGMSSLDYFRAKPEEPLRFVARGPSRYRLELRTVRSVAADEPLDATLVVRHGDVLDRIPLSAEGRSPSLTFESIAGVAATGRRSIDSRQYVDLLVEQGADEVEVAVEGAELLVRVFALRPHVPLSGGPWSLPRPATESGPAVSICESSLRQPDENLCYGRLAQNSFAATAQSRRAAGPLRLRVGFSASDASERSRQVSAILRQGSSHDPVLRHQAWMRAEALHAAYPRAADVGELVERLGRGGRWERLSSLQSSAGVRRVEGVGWSPEDPRLRVRRLLFEGLEAADQVVVGRQRLGFSSTGESRRSLRLELESLAVPPLDNVVQDVLVQIDEREPERLRLPADTPLLEHLVELEAGEHEVRVWLERPRSSHYLRVRLAEETATGPVIETRNWRRDYHLSTLEEPLRLRVQGPAWLRVDEWHDADIRTVYRVIDSEGWQTVTLEPPPGSSSAAYRVFKRERGELGPPLGGAIADVGSASLRSLGFAPAWASEVWPPFDGERPGVNRGSTLSVRVGAERRRYLEEEIAEERGADQFVEAAVTHRSRRSLGLDGRRYLEAGLFARTRDVGEPTVGTEVRWRLEPGAWAFDLSAIGLAQEVAQGSSEWAATARASAVRSFSLSDRTRVGLRFGGFARQLSLDSELPIELRDKLDQDVFTSYKAEHSRGGRVAGNMSFLPHRDVQVWSELSVLTNEGFADLDRAEFQVALRQLFGSLRVDLRARFARFFSDEDRSQNFDRQRLDLRGSWERWNRRLGRWEVQGTLGYDFQAGDTSGTLSLSRHFSEGRLLDDFRPAAADFRRLRLGRLDLESED